MTVSAAQPTYFPTLDGWRAIAIVAVMASHSLQLFDTRGVFPSQTMQGFLRNLRIGVDLFFAISGFLITSLLVRESAQTGTVSLRGFYIRRAFRILPVIIAYLLVLALMSSWLPGLVAPWEFPVTILFARNYLMHWVGGATQQFWSLSVEEHFYLLWPPILVLVGTKRALRLAIFGVFAIAVWRAADSRYHFFSRVFSEDAGVLYRSDTRFDALLAGGIAALTLDRAQGSFDRVRSWPVTGCIFVVLALAVAEHVRAAPSVLVVLFPLLILSTICRPSSFVSRALEARPLRWLGQLSYSVYVWQTLFLQVPQTSFSQRALGSSPTLQVGAYLLDLGLVFGCALVSNKVVEGPLRRKGRELAQASDASRVRTT
ncbi:MAG: acyltransferase [Pseudomonadota bacterium]